MLGDNVKIAKEDQLRRVYLGEVWLPNKRFNPVADYAMRQNPEWQKMTKNGAVAAYLLETIRAAIKKAENNE